MIFINLTEISLSVFGQGSDKELHSLLGLLVDNKINLDSSCPILIEKNHFYIFCNFESEKPDEIIKTITDEGYTITKMTYNLSNKNKIKLRAETLKSDFSNLTTDGTNKDNKWLSKFKQIHKK